MASMKRHFITIPNPERSIEHTEHDERVMGRIKGAELIKEQIGRWPNFHDFEVITISLDRSPYQEGIACDLRAIFFIYDTRERESSPKRRPAHAEILFHDIDELTIEGFNQQNPIMGLGLHLVFCERLKTERIMVEWGGTCMPHDVQFRCSSITVVRVIDLDPFQKGSADERP
ncbi:MAG TPA: hypothetical protein VLZ30_11665 [Verrucomicrobiae bacterium]|nr:hypothetical protein [Verrucomicrobiae bacterium]